jgi:hypothetical protein
MDFSFALSPVPAIIIFGPLVWLLALTFFWWRERKSDRAPSGGVDKLTKQLEAEIKKTDDLSRLVGDIKKNSLYNIQKIGLVRFNPFAEAGGDQSFCLALLDGEDSGLVVSSLHSREMTRIYAKPVKKGAAATYDLSAEEKQAILKAKRINK